MENQKFKVLPRTGQNFQCGPGDTVQGQSPPHFFKRLPPALEMYTKMKKNVPNGIQEANKENKSLTKRDNKILGYTTYFVF